MSSGSASANGSAAPSAATLPSWYPGWARELAESYFSGTINTFVLYGNVHDLVRCEHPGGGETFVSLADFLAGQLFGSWDVVVGYDLGRGLRPLAGADPKRLQAMMQYVASVIGLPATWPRDPDKVLDLVDQMIQRSLLVEDAATRKRTAFLFEHAQYLHPTGDLASLARGQAARLVRFLSWAANPYIKRLNLAFCMMTDKLSELSERVVNNPHVTAIEIPLPTADERRRFIVANWAGPNGASTSNGASASSNASASSGASASTSAPAATSASAATSGASASPAASAIAAGAATSASSEKPTLTQEGLVQNSAGLSLVNLNVLLANAGTRGLDLNQFRKLKKSLIERQCQGLVEFVEPPHTLDLIVGQPEAKTRLQQDAKWIADGRLETAPMGYLFCGSVGTGKTFLAECYAGSIGIPCVKLRNFRSKFVGETEGNLEQVLTVLRSLGPVVVIVDEADASLGDRRADGDSGTSGRVFSMIAQQMGDTRYRGRIIWMLLTCRPDLLPIDLKRQGRCEVHIPLFAPTTSDEIVQMFRAMAKKNKVALTPDAIPEFSPERQLSGADLESILLAARRRALSSGRATVERADLQASADEFIPSSEGLEKEMQELAAVLECTERNFLPTVWRERLSAPEARGKLQERMIALRQLVEGT
ncbi:MAG TPA: ATP-binding protein [Pirellulaceae bacterium]|nr:ATP-binding protein [Pirellulaceae bacterium]